MGESAEDAMKMAKRMNGKVRRLFVGSTVEVPEEVSRKQREEAHGSKEKMEKKVKNIKTGNSEKTGFGCDKPWP